MEVEAQGWMVLWVLSPKKVDLKDPKQRGHPLNQASETASVF